MQQISSSAIYAMSVVAGFFLFRQWREIKKNPALRGRSVSIIFFLYFAAVMPVQIAYGIEGEKWPLVVNAAIRLAGFMLVLTSLWQCGKFTTRSYWWLAALSVISVGGAVTPFRNLVFVSMCVGGAAFSVPAAWEIWKEKSAGAVTVGFHWMSLASVTFWFWYGLTIHDWTVWGSVPFYWAAIGSTIYLFYKYR